MSKRHNILPKSTNFFIELQEKLKACKGSKLNFSRSYFIADDGHVKIICRHVAVFSKHDILQIL